MSQIALYRRLYRELRATRSIVPTWDYVVKRTRELQANSDVKTEVDNLKLLTVYVEYLENLRLHKVHSTRLLTPSHFEKELIKKHSGKGERSVEESAKIVGLKLPHES